MCVFTPRITYQKSPRITAVENPWGLPKVAVKGLYKLTKQPKKNYFFISFRYAISTKSTSLIPNMKSVFFYHVPFRRYRGPPASNFDFLNYFGQLKGAHRCQL